MFPQLFPPRDSTYRKFSILSWNFAFKPHFSPAVEPDYAIIVWLAKFTFFFNSYTNRTIIVSTVEVLCLNYGNKCIIKHDIPSYVYRMIYCVQMQCYCNNWWPKLLSQSLWGTASTVYCQMPRNINILLCKQTTRSFQSCYCIISFMLFWERK